ncbi:MAG: hypothetical protein AAFX93_18495 [Verrucomicrobiota bacterium]
MKNSYLYNLSLTLLIVASTAFTCGLDAKTSPFKNSNRIAISADGNPDADPDDIGATALTLAVLAKAGLQDNLVHYDFNNWMEYKPIPPQRNRLWDSAMGGQSRWGFNGEKFFDVTQDPDAAVANLTAEINKSTASDPLYVIAAGPVQLLYRAMAAANPEARNHVVVVSHHYYNNYYKPRLWQRNIDDLQALHPDLKLIQIKDQNPTLKTKGDDAWFWLRDHSDPNLQWVFERIEAGPSDVSDAGIATWLIGLNGDDERITIAELSDWIGSDPIPTNGGSANAPAAPPAVTPEINLPVTDSIFQEVDGRIVIEAESVPLDGDWVIENTEPDFTGSGYVRYMPSNINAINQQSRGVLIYKIRITEPGKYHMALKHSHRGAPERDKWNDCWTLVGIDPAPWGNVRKTYHSLTKEQYESGVGFTFQTTHDNYGVLAKREGHFSKPIYDLDAGEHYFFVVGRSGGYRLDKIHFFKEGVSGFQDDSIPPTPIISGDAVNL